MKSRIILGVAILVSGCASGPRPYDGVIGYQVTNKDGATRVTYVDEAGVDREKTIARVAKVCSSQANLTAGRVIGKVTSEEQYLVDVSISVPVPVGFTTTGDERGVGASGAAAMRESVSQNQAMTRQMKVRRIRATCTVVAP